MADIRDKHNRHLFLEDKPVTHESFIANVNKAVEHLDDIADFNNIMGQEGVTEFVSTIIDSLEDETNKWVEVIEETAQSILEGKSAISFTTVMTVPQDYDAGATIALPGIFRYKVGAGALMVYYNGAACYPDIQFEEVGTAGENSAEVLFNFPLRCGDQLCFRVVSLIAQDLYAAIINEIQNILSTDIPVIATGSTTPRYLTDRFADVINVKDFGAVGDGVTNDTAAFAAAMAYGDSLGYPYVLYLPVGEYYITSLPDVPCYGTGNILYQDYNYHPFELLFKIRGGIIKDDDGRYKLDFDCLTDADRIALISQIIVENKGISLDDTGRMYLNFSAMSTEDLTALIKQIIRDGGGLEIDEEGKIYIKFDSMSAEDLANLINQIIAESGLLQTDDDGKIIVDFSNMTAEQINQLVTVLIANNSGLVLNSNNKLGVDFSNISTARLRTVSNALVQSGGGLYVDNSGKIYVSFDTMSSEDLIALIEQIVEEGDGLYINSDGKLALNITAGNGIELTVQDDEINIGTKIQEGGGLAYSNQEIYVDFDLMPEDKFVTLLYSLNLPTVLTADTDMYVNINTGSDDTSDITIGRTEDNPFKTIGACITYIINHFNLQNYNVNIYVAPGTYTLTETIQASEYTTNNGSIAIRALDKSNSPIIQGTNVTLVRVTKGFYRFYGITFYLICDYDTYPHTGTSTYYINCCTCESLSRTYFYGCRFIRDVNNLSGIRTFMIATTFITAGQKAEVILYHDTESYQQASMTSNVNAIETYGISALALEGSARISLGQFTPGTLSDSRSYTILCYGTYTQFIGLNTNSVFSARVEDLGATVIFQNNGCSGIRYVIEEASIITVQGQGENFFPGDTAGVIQSGTNCVYY